jgi:hypothetical protein
MTQQIYRLVTTGPMQMPSQGGIADVPVGSTINRVMIDPAAPFTPPPNTQLLPDDGSPIWAPPPPVVTVVDAYVWLQRLPEPVQVSVATAAQTNPVLLVGLTLLTAAGTVDLADPTGQLRGFLNAAVAATANMANPLTAAQAAAMMQP